MATDLTDLEKGKQLSHQFWLLSICYLFLFSHFIFFFCLFLFLSFYYLNQADRGPVVIVSGVL